MEGKLEIFQRLGTRMEKENFSDEEYSRLFKKELAAMLNAEIKENLSIAISFKTWMETFKVPISEEHSGCDCCSESNILGRTWIPS